nr:MAG TPA: hypothetical protein [Caudoviricetes sp.]
MLTPANILLAWLHISIAQLLCQVFFIRWANFFT